MMAKRDHVPYLYHGTSCHAVEDILRSGVKPSGRTVCRLNPAVRVNPNYVYLTDAYPLAYMFWAVLRNQQRFGAVIEIDTARLDENRLLPNPNEDAMRLRDPPGVSLGTDAWTRSLEATGSCCHSGTVPREAFTRIVKIDVEKNYHLAFRFGPIWAAYLADYFRLGPWLRAATLALFGDEPDDELRAKIEERCSFRGPWDPELKNAVVKQLNLAKAGAG